jgi:hypothetical protein
MGSCRWRQLLSSSCLTAAFTAACAGSPDGGDNGLASGGARSGSGGTNAVSGAPNAAAGTGVAGAMSPVAGRAGGGSAGATSSGAAGLPGAGGSPMGGAAGASGGSFAGSPPSAGVANGGAAGGRGGRAGSGGSSGLGGTPGAGGANMAGANMAGAANTGGAANAAVCTRIKTEYATELQKQVSCDPRLSRTQCGGRVASGAGCGCQVFVEPKDLFAIENLANVQDEWFTANCSDAMCPATCPSAARATCQADSSLDLGGRCVTVP